MKNLTLRVCIISMIAITSSVYAGPNPFLAPGADTTKLPTADESGAAALPQSPYASTKKTDLGRDNSIGDTLKNLRVVSVSADQALISAGPGAGSVRVKHGQTAYFGDKLAVEIHGEQVVLLDEEASVVWVGAVATAEPAPRKEIPATPIPDVDGDFEFKTSSSLSNSGGAGGNQNSSMSLGIQ